MGFVYDSDASNFRESVQPEVKAEQYTIGTFCIPSSLKKMWYGFIVQGTKNKF